MKGYYQYNFKVNPAWSKPKMTVTRKELAPDQQVTYGVGVGYRSTTPGVICCLVNLPEESEYKALKAFEWFLREEACRTSKCADAVASLKMDALVAL